VEIECSNANIFDQKADVLVCPSGPHLNFIQGLAKEISKRAGKMFQMHCDDVKGHFPKVSGYYLFCPPFGLYQ
jgi:sugar phosphate isomerase/epimerase